MERHIVALGGISEETSRALARYAVGLAGRPRPSLLFLPTASAEDPSGIVRIYEQLAGLAEISHLKLFPWPPDDLRERVLGSDVVYVGGGNTANMLAVWRVHGLDELLREAWERGVVLCGWSAGAVCWFEACVTDSFGPELAGLEDGLGFLPGSACPHYDGEERRRPVYHELVAAGFPAGIAIDDGVAAHFVGTHLAEVVSARPEGQAYRVELRDGEVVETPLEARRLP